jgi:hypothetical protein
MNASNRLLNFCGVPLDSGTDATLNAAETAFEAAYRALLAQYYIENLPDNLSDLLILGKRGESNAASKLKGRFYLFDSNGAFNGYSTPETERCNIRLVKSYDGQLYILNSETGLSKLDEAHKNIVPNGKFSITDFNEPRYNKSADVYIGVQSEGSDVFGRPVLDAAIDENYVYVVPVVVNPVGENSYTAAAQLQLLEGGNPPYKVTRIYDEPPLEYDNQYRDNLRELELDDSGNLYVLNVHSINESDILWKFDPNGSVERLDLGIPDSNNYVEAPVGLYVSDTTNMLYMASALYDFENGDSAVIYGFTTEGPLQLERFITVNNMQTIMSITENPSTGSLWVTGFNMYDVPLYPNPNQPAFYYPFIAEIPIDSNEVQSISIYDPDNHDLALPTSIIWTGNDL